MSWGFYVNVIPVQILYKNCAIVCEHNKSTDTYTKVSIPFNMLNVRGIVATSQSKRLLKYFRARNMMLHLFDGWNLILMHLFLPLDRT